MDGRAWLRRTERRYDLITLEPMPPNFAGVNALYSLEGAQPAAGEGSEGAQLVAEDIAEGAEVAAEVGVAAVAVSDEMLSEQVVPILEAVLYAAEEPVPVTEIVEVLAKVGKEQDREWANGVSVLLVGRLAILLSDRLLRSGSALQVLEVAGGFRLGTRPRFDPWIRALRQVERPIGNRS